MRIGDYIEILFERNLCNLNQSDFKYGFALTCVDIKYHKMGFPICTITYSTPNAKLNILDDGSYSNEVSFEVAMDKKEFCTIINFLVTSSIADGIRYLISR